MGRNYDDCTGPLGLVDRKALEQVKAQFTAKVHVQKEQVGLATQEQFPGLIDRRGLVDLAHLRAKQIQFATQGLAAWGFVVEQEGLHILLTYLKPPILRPSGARGRPSFPH